MSNPKVVSLCVTYGRPVLLGEAIKCFIDQDYDNKELIVLNDQEGVTLKLENCPSNIKIINHPKRFNSLGEKRNYIKGLAQADFYCIWDDDDLYTPWRISESVDLMRINKGYDIIKAKDAFLSVNNKDYKVANNLFHSQAIITKEYIGKNQYPDISVGEDRIFEGKAKIYSADIFPNFHYIYRWGLNIHHLSGISNEKKSWERALTFEPYKMNGEVVVKPLFQKDYWRDIGMVMYKINPIWGKGWERKIKL